MKTLRHALAGFLGLLADAWQRCRGKIPARRRWPPCVQALYRPWPPDTPQAAAPRPVSIGVFLHVYYPDLILELLEAVLHVPAGASIFISTDTTQKKDAIAAACAAKGVLDRTCVRVFPNEGWDIAPFLVGFGQVLPRYDLILRLHAKRSVHLEDGAGQAWRDMLYAALAGSEGQVQRILGAFQGDPGLGLVCPPHFPYYADSCACGRNLAGMRSLLAPYGVQLEPDTPIDFPMGSMFWCRPRVLAPWLRLGLDFADFGPTRAEQRDGTLAHALERLFLFGCGLEGQTWTRTPLPVRNAYPAASSRPRPWRCAATDGAPGCSGSRR